MVRMLGITAAIVACLAVGTCNACSCIQLSPDQRYCNAEYLFRINVQTDGVLVFPGTTYQQFVGLTTDYRNIAEQQHKIEVTDVIRKPKLENRKNLMGLNVLQTLIGGSLCGVQLKPGDYIMEVYKSTSVTPPFGDALRTNSCSFNKKIESNDDPLLTNPPNCQDLP